MAKIDLKFMKADKGAVKAMRTTYTHKKGAKASKPTSKKK